MPEGPEFRRAADKIEKALRGRKIKLLACFFGRCRCIHHRKHIASGGYIWESICTCFWFETAIYVHLQLYGVWKTGRATTIPKTTRSLRLRLESTKIMLLCIQQQTSRCCKLKMFPTIPISDGPDLLEQSIRRADIQTDAGKSLFSKAIGGQLLSEFFAGVELSTVGNSLYRQDASAQVIGKLTPKQRLILALHHRHNPTCLKQEDHNQCGFVRNAKKNDDIYIATTYLEKNIACPVWIHVKKIMTGGRRLYYCLTAKAAKRQQRSLESEGKTNWATMYISYITNKYSHLQVAVVVCFLCAKTLRLRTYR